MSERDQVPAPGASDPYDWSYEAHARRQARLGLELTPAERLRWLEDTNAMMRELLGRAQAAAVPTAERKTSD